MISEQLYGCQKLFEGSAGTPFLGRYQRQEVGTIFSLVQIVGLADLGFEGKFRVVDQQRQVFSFLDFMCLKGQQFDLFADLLQLHVGLLLHGGEGLVFDHPFFGWTDHGAGYRSRVGKHTQLFVVDLHIGIRSAIIPRSFLSEL